MSIPFDNEEENEEEEFDDLESENEFKKLKLALEHGMDLSKPLEESGLPPEIEGQFLDYVQQWEDEMAKGKMILIYDLIGRPEYKLVAEITDENMGEEAGIKSATIQISGANAYGWLKTETGVHRLVRISPYDSNARRHTSFSSVSVTPVVDENVPIEILEKDLKIDVYRASGAGGQHVNKTESAVRFTHMPTGIIVACQQERSQHKNRAKAMEMLRARLYEMELRKREAAAADLESQKSEIGWGHQIRSYVLQPYQMIKDARTGVETSQSQAVLDGDIDLFLRASLASRIKGQVE